MGINTWAAAQVSVGWFTCAAPPTTRPPTPASPTGHRRVGSLHTSGDELMKAVTGAPLDPQVFLAYIKDKYSELYRL